VSAPDPGPAAPPPPEPPVGEHWFEAVADHLGPAYLRYAFTKGTDQEVDAIVAELGLAPGARVLDVGCGPGRHAHALARRGFPTHGIDISERFVELARAGAPAGATFERADARSLVGRDDLAGGFDVAVSLCEGAFGLVLTDGADLEVLAGMAQAVRPGGRVVLSAFNAYFALLHGAPGTFDALRGVNHELTEIRDPQGRAVTVDLWTSTYTPRELRLALRIVGLRVDAMWAVEPGAYRPAPPGTDTPEFLVFATRA
jgi:SAM-dependent methyltransferase